MTQHYIDFNKPLTVVEQELLFSLVSSQSPSVTSEHDNTLPQPQVTNNFFSRIQKKDRIDPKQNQGPPGSLISLIDDPVRVRFYNEEDAQKQPGQKQKQRIHRVNAKKVMLSHSVVVLPDNLILVHNWSADEKLNGNFGFYIPKPLLYKMEDGKLVKIDTLYGLKIHKLRGDRDQLQTQLESVGNEMELFNRTYQELNTTDTFQPPAVILRKKGGAPFTAYAYTFIKNIPGTSLKEQQKTTTRRDFKSTLNLLEAVVCGVKFFQVQNPRIVHGDIKPDNLLYKERAYLVDFGLSCQKNTVVPARGTPLYMSPRLMKAFGTTPCVHNEEDDVYSLGQTLAEMLLGTTRKDAILAEDKKLKKALSMDKWKANRDMSDFYEENIDLAAKYPRVSAEYRQYLSSALSKMPKKMPKEFTARQLSDRLFLELVSAHSAKDLTFVNLTTLQRLYPEIDLDVLESLRQVLLKALSVDENARGTVEQLLREMVRFRILYAQSETKKIISEIQNVIVSLGGKFSMLGSDDDSDSDNNSDIGRAVDDGESETIKGLEGMQLSFQRVLLKLNKIGVMEKEDVGFIPQVRASFAQINKIFLKDNMQDKAIFSKYDGMLRPILDLFSMLIPIVFLVKGIARLVKNKTLLESKSNSHNMSIGKARIFLFGVPDSAVVAAKVKRDMLPLFNFTL